ncbi:MAG: type II toxin-antitoxin system death-on-curing family toxin [Nitrospirota bacterium]
MTPLFLTMEEAREIHADQIERYGGSPGIRDITLLQSAIAMPAAGFGEQYLHADLFEMAAACLFHIVNDHPFVDGNKRVGIASALVFLELNGVGMKATNDALVEMVLAVVEHTMAKAGIAEFFRAHAMKSKK